MNKPINRALPVLLGAFLFSIIFWQEKLGVNTLLFGTFISAAIFYLYPGSLRSRAVAWLLLGQLACLAMVLLHNTLLSKIGFAVTLTLMAVFAEYKHRSPWFATGSLLTSILFFPASLLETMQGSRQRPARKSNSRFFILIRLSLLPLLLAAAFFLIYFSANKVFQDMTTHLLYYLNYAWLFLAAYLSWQWLLLLLLGLLICTIILLKSKTAYFSKKDQSMKDDLQRTRRTLARRMRQPVFSLMETVMGRLARGPLALKYAHSMGAFSLALLNILLLVVNSIDIRFLWLNQARNQEIPLYQQLHEGTGLLTLSILLAMLVLLCFFRGNLNFYSKNGWLKFGAYCWILQNGLLTASVFLRDYDYIQQYGLTYKRLGVLFFLLMVLTGLLTVLVKIAQKKTSYFLFRVNAWAAVVVLVAACGINWDQWIARYNLQHRDRVPLDLVFLLNLSDKTLPLLHQYKDALVERQAELDRGQPASALITLGNSPAYLIQQLEQREQQFLQKQQQFSWLSWNYADAAVRNYLLAGNTVLPLQKP